MWLYLVILLDDASTSYCHYRPHPQSLSQSGGRKSLMPIDTLKNGIRFGMKENLMIQFVYPERPLPEEYNEVVESIDHSKIKLVNATTPNPSFPKEGSKDADVLVVNEWDTLPQKAEVPIVIRTSKDDFFARYKEIFTLLANAPRVNISFTDVEAFTEADFETYKNVLAEIGKEVERLFVKGKTPQLNLLTDRMMLTQMNNCGAGDTTITLAPNGKFYVCPAFYYEDEKDCIGDLEHGLDVKNKQLYKLEYAPICRHCDAYQCHRCIWLNRKLTLEVNTPSREQCVIAHLERNASRELLANIRKHGTFMPDTEIKEIDYLDPFDKREEW